VAFGHRMDVSLRRAGIGESLEFTARRSTEDVQRLASYVRIAPEHTGIAMDVFCANMFADLATRYVHGYGLTEPILARVDAPEERPGHKARLIGLARDLLVLRTWDQRTQPGLAKRAASHGRAPKWIQDNLDTISVVERRMYNEHHFLSNLRLALVDPGRIHV
jgi:hypothetical protein